MKNKKKPIKLVYDEPPRFSIDRSALEEQRMSSDHHFNMTCSCGTTFPVPIDITGNIATCPKCSRQVKIPEEDFIPITCGCGKPLRIPRVTTGRDKKCPQCKKPVKLLGMPSEQSQQVKPSLEGPSAAAASKAEETPTRTRTVFVNVPCSCGKKLVLPLSLVQQPIKCPQCQRVFSLPEKHFIQMKCSCGMAFKVLRILEGNYGKCPKCGKALKITGK